MKKIKKSVWLPLLLAVYCGAISCYFGPRLIEEGRGSKFWISVAFEAVVIIGLYFALHRKEKLSHKWEKEIRHNK